MLHRDSLGSEQAIRPGDINLMIAGRGIVHSERESADAVQSRRRLHGLQLWLALPEESENTEPRFLHYPASSIPTTSVDGVPVRIMIGTAYGCESPVATLSRTLYVEARLTAGQSLPMPESADPIALYFISGQVRLGEQTVEAGSMLVIDPPARTAIVADNDCVLVLVGGAPLGDRHFWWNFVSSQQAAIDRARRDWQEGRFPKVPGDSEEFIPLPDPGD
jgi:redox-sensitive bicupin YhaK (pirin superfamily)